MRVGGGDDVHIVFTVECNKQPTIHILLPLQGVFNLRTFSPGRCPGLGNDMSFQGIQITPHINLRADNGRTYIAGRTMRTSSLVYIISMVERTSAPNTHIPYPGRGFLLIGATQSTTFSPQNTIINNQQLPR